jgi:hypothetical protein
MAGMWYFMATAEFCGWVQFLRPMWHRTTEQTWCCRAAVDGRLRFVTLGHNRIRSLAVSCGYATR